MAAAAWTATAIDITGEGPDRWAEYLTAEQLSDKIGLAPKTIMDTLTRRPLSTDPRSAICQPAARIGQTAVAAVPMWEPQQAGRYRALAVKRVRVAPAKRRKLPVYDVATAAERGLMSTEDLAEYTSMAENTLRRWSRENRDFPVEVGIAARVPPHQYGPPRTLRRRSDVVDWLLGSDRLITREELARRCGLHETDIEAIAAAGPDALPDGHPHEAIAKGPAPCGYWRPDQAAEYRAKAKRERDAVAA